MKVTFVDFEEINIPFTSEVLFELRPDKHYLWIQKLCFWVLGKIGANHCGRNKEVRRVEFDPEDVVTQIFKQRDSVMANFGNETTCLLIGSRDFAELMNTEEIFRCVNFNSSYERHSEVGRQVFGLEVKVIPWMDGIIVI